MLFPNIGLTLDEDHLREDPMAHVIDGDECVNCGACEPECPVEAISEKGGVRVIDPDTCTDCGSCVDACPADCISQA